MKPISRFGSDGQTRLDIPANGEWIPVEYTAKRGRHTLVIGKSRVKFTVVTLGGRAVKVKCG